MTGRPELSRWQMLSIAVAFLATGSVTAYLTDSYIATPFKIASCRFDPPRPGDVLVRCWRGAQDYYYSGSIFLDIDEPLVEGLKSADVVVLGNSRTVRTFPAPSIDRYFKAKGLRYFVLAAEGSGFRFSQMILEKLGAHPRILLVNNESFYVDVLEDTYRDFVLSPDRFRPSFVAFNYSKKMLALICGSSLEALKHLYCRGDKGKFRSAVNGTFFDEMEDAPQRFPVQVPPETRMANKDDVFMPNARAFLDSASTRDACLIDYLIPSDIASVDLARSMAADLGAPFVYPEVSGLYTFDHSHLVPESSERWAAAFVKLLDPAIDACLHRPSNDYYSQVAGAGARRPVAGSQASSGPSASSP